MGRESLDPDEVADLAEFVGWVRQQWKLCGNAEARGQFETRLRNASYGYVQDALWKGQHDSLQARVWKIIEHERAEVADHLRTLERVRVLFGVNRGKKTLRLAELELILSKCGVCGLRDAERPAFGSLLCGQCIEEAKEAGRIA